MNGNQHTDEHMNDNEEAVNDNMSDKTAKQRERERGGERAEERGGGERRRREEEEGTETDQK